MSSPCYQCADRELGCHSTCEKYSEYRNKNIRRSKANVVNTMCNELNFSSVRKSMTSKWPQKELRIFTQR